MRSDGPVRLHGETGEISIETLDLPRSQRCYVAQAIRLVVAGDRAHLHFGQIVHPRKLLSVAVVELTIEALVRLHGSVHQGFRETLRGFLPSEGLVLSDAEIEALSEDRFFVCSANVGRMTVSQVGGQVDWFHLEPAEIRRLSMKLPFRHDSLSAPLTVLLSGALVAELVRQLDHAIESMKPAGLGIVRGDAEVGPTGERG